MKKLILSLSLIASTLHAATFTGADGVTVEVDQPRRIVALNYSTVEILQALGVDDRIVGVDTTGTRLLPKRKDLADFGHPYRPSIEGVISTQPDLVIGTEDTLLKISAEQLRSAKVPVLMLESSSQDGIEGLKRRIAVLAAVFEKPEAGRALSAELDQRVAVLQAANAKLTARKRVFFLYTHGPGSAIIYGRNTGTHWLIELAGGINAADFTEGTKPLTPEAMVKSDPDAILLLKRGFDSVKGMEGVMKLPGVTLTQAAKNQAIYVVDDNIRWIGLSFLDQVEAVHRQLYAQP